MSSDPLDTTEALAPPAGADPLTVAPATAWPDATQTTYRVVTQPLPYTSAVASYSPDVTSEPTADYGSRMLAALRLAARTLEPALGDVRRSLEPSSGEPLAEQHMIELRTIAASPGVFTIHLLAGALSALEHTVLGILALAQAAVKLTATLVECSVEHAAVGFARGVEQWISGGSEPAWPTGSVQCETFKAQVQQTRDVLVTYADRLRALANDPAALIDAGVAVAANLLEFLSELQLGDRYADAVRDPAKLGALIGVVTAEIAMLIAPMLKTARAETVAGVATGVTEAAEQAATVELRAAVADALAEASVRRAASQGAVALKAEHGAPQAAPAVIAEASAAAQAAGDAAEVGVSAGEATLAERASTALKQADEASIVERRAAMAELRSGMQPAATEQASLAAMHAAGYQARLMLRGAGMSHLESFGANGGAGLSSLIANTPAADLTQALTRAFETVGAATRVVYSRVRPYAQMTDDLSAVNASQRLVIGTEAVASDEPVATAAKLALMRSDDSLSEAAHLIDKRFIGEKGPKRCAADFAAIGLANPNQAPAFAALRATHRTTTDRLIKLGAPIPAPRPEVTSATITNRMNKALPLKTRASEAARLVVDDATPAWQVVKAQYEEYVKMNMTAHPAWTEIRTTMFATQKKLLAEVAKTDAAAAKQAADAWPEFEVWATPPGY